MAHMFETRVLQRKSFYLAWGLVFTVSTHAAYAAKEFSDSEVVDVVSVSTNVQPSRIQHAQELMGKKQKKSLLKKAEKIENLDAFVLELSKKFLPQDQIEHAPVIARSIISEARAHGFDPLFVVAVIQNESSFHVDRKGAAGEIGLMQIKPDTAKWIAQIAGIPYDGEKSLLQPEINIRLGVALMDKLRDQFDSQSRMYISAYNVGATKLRSLVDEDRPPKEYVMAVMKRYLAIYKALSETELTNQIEVAYESVRKLTQSI